jgi:hypothetical protein
LHRQGVPVVDLVNGMSSDTAAAHSLVSFEEMGYRKDNIDSYDRETSLAPGGFQATYASNIRLTVD